MIKKLLFILCLIFVNNLFANTILLDNRDKINVSTNIKVYLKRTSIEELIQRNNGYSPFSYHHYVRQAYKKDHWFKFSVKNSFKEEVTRELLLKWNNVNLTMYIVDDGEILRKKRININDKSGLKTVEIKFPANKTLDFYFFYDSVDKDDELYYMLLTKKDVVFDTVAQYETFFNNGFFLGILFIMAIYSIFMFKTTKEKSYLYYTIFQVSAILIISDFRFLVYGIFGENHLPAYIILKVLLPLILFSSSFLFTQEFLDTKQKFPIVHKIIWVIIGYLVVLSVQKTFTNDEVIPNLSSFVAIILVITGIRAYLNGQKEALYYIFGTVSYIGFLIFYNSLIIFEYTVGFEYIDFIKGLSISITLESLFFTLAIHYKLKNVLDTKLEQEKMFIAQSRLACMGEMIGNIAHQWRQPLNNISSILTNITFHSDMDKLSKEFLKNKIEQSNKQLEYMSHTIEDFRNFFATDTTKSDFSASEICNESIELMSASFNTHQIEVEKDMEDFSIYGCRGEFSQVLVVILSNAKDVLKTREIENKKIYISVKNRTITIEDNAGGIAPNNITKVFDPYFTTKDKTSGTGLGLYISRVIVEEKMHGILKVHNTKRGAIFTILL